MVRRLSDVSQKNLIKYILEGKSNSANVKKLRVSLSSVKRMRDELKKPSILAQKKQPGRKRILTEKNVNTLRKTAKENPFASTLTIFKRSKVLCDRLPSRMTMCRYMRLTGLRSFVAARKPFLTDLHVQERLRVARFILDQTDSYIESLLPSDECKFNIAGNDVRVRIWRELIQGTINSTF